jgi:CheY-specific phosphatase CheX
MSEPTSELLAETLAGTLEEAAFVFVEARESPPAFPARVLEARIGYAGPGAGELILVADSSMAATLAANLLGEEEGEATASSAPDALGELLNMVVGAFVVRLFGAEARCKLGVPRVREVGASDHQARLGARACTAHLVEEEGRRIDLSLAVGGTAP